MLTRQLILAAQDLPFEDVEVPEWGGTVRISTMTGAMRDAWEQSLVVPGKGEPDVSNVRAKLVAACAVDESGERLFSASDVAALGRKSGAALDRLARVAQRLNRISEKAQEEARGNSSGDRSAASTSSSPTGTESLSASSSGDGPAQS